MVFFASIAAFPNLQFFFFILLLVRQGYICRWKGKILFYLISQVVCCMSCLLRCVGDRHPLWIVWYIVIGFSNCILQSKEALINLL